MDTRPIAVFDSGMGGLTAMRQLLKLMPNEDIVYFGDTGRVPYGGRSAETIIQYARQDVAFLKTFHPKAILIACGTVSSTAMETLKQENALPIFGVVEPAVQAAVKASRQKRIGIIGTMATIRTGVYTDKVKALCPEAVVVSKACPLFVPLVENGRVGKEDIVAREVVKDYLTELKESEVDTLILGCTHYPFLMDVISDFMGNDVVLIDTGRESSLALKEELLKCSLQNDTEHTAIHRYYASDSAEDFSTLASMFLQEEISERVGYIDISQY